MTKSKKILNIFTAVIALLLLGCTAASLIRRARTEPVVTLIEPAYEDAERDGQYITLFTLPASAVEWGDGGTAVYVTRESLGLFGTVYDAERVPVTVESRTDSGSLVVTGSSLHRWDHVIVDPGERVADGTRVRARET